MRNRRPSAPHRRIARPKAIDFSKLSLTELRIMSAAGHEIRECYRALAKTGDNIVGKVLRDQGVFREWDHYPQDDVYDAVTHAQFYYQAHPPGRRAWHKPIPFTAKEIRARSLARRAAGNLCASKTPALPRRNSGGAGRGARNAPLARPARSRYDQTFN